MLRSIAMLIISFTIFSNLQAQHLIKDVELVKTKDNIINIYQNENTGEIFRHYSNKVNLDLGLISELLDENTQEGIIWENGKKIPFAKGEHLLAARNDIILTAKHMWDVEKEESISEVRRYTIFQRSLLESEGVLHIAKKQTIIMLENGNFIITNFTDNYGTEFMIYSSNMKLLETYKPYMLGFKNIQFAENRNIIMAAVYPTKTHRENTIKLYFINSKSGRILRKKEIYDNFSTEKMFAVNDLFILYGEGWINTFTKDGKSKWDREFKEPVSVFEGDLGTYLYVVTNKKIYCLKKKNGHIKWSKKISQYYELNLSEKMESVVDITVIPLGIYSLFHGSDIGVIIGQKKGTLGKSKLRHQIILFRLDKKGELIDQTHLAKKSETVTLISENNEFKVITDNSVKTYTK